MIHANRNADRATVTPSSATRSFECLVEPIPYRAMVSIESTASAVKVR